MTLLSTFNIYALSLCLPACLPLSLPAFPLPSVSSFHISLAHNTASIAAPPPSRTLFFACLETPSIQMSNTRGTYRRPWTAEEDQLLKELVGTYGTLSWKMLGSHFPGRNGKQCRERCALLHLFPVSSAFPLMHIPLYPMRLQVAQSSGCGHP